MAKGLPILLPWKDPRATWHNWKEQNRRGRHKKEKKHAKSLPQGRRDVTTQAGAPGDMIYTAQFLSQP